MDWLQTLKGSLQYFNGIFMVKLQKRFSQNGVFCIKIATTQKYFSDSAAIFRKCTDAKL